MQANIDELAKVMNESRQEIQMFLEDEENSKVFFFNLCVYDLFLIKKENTHIEFNTLSVIYQKPSSKFIKPFEHFNIQRFFLKHIFLYIFMGYDNKIQ